MGLLINTTLYHADTGTEKQVKSMAMNDIEFTQAYHKTFDRNNNILATGELRNTIYFWDLVEGVRKKTLSGQKGGLNCLAFSPDGKTLASGGEGEFIRGEDGNFRRDNGVFHVWDAVKGKRKHSFSRENMYDIRSVAFSPDGNLLAGGDEFRFPALLKYNIAFCYAKLAEAEGDAPLYIKAEAAIRESYQTAILPDHQARILYLWGYILFKQGRYEEASAKFKSISVPRSSQYGDTARLMWNSSYALGKAYLELGEEAAARLAFTRLLKDYPNTSYKAEVKKLLKKE